MPEHCRTFQTPGEPFGSTRTTGSRSAEASTRSSRNVVLPDVGSPAASPVAGHLGERQVYRRRRRSTAHPDVSVFVSDAASSTPASNPPWSANADRLTRRRRPGGHGHNCIHQATDGQHCERPENQSVGHGITSTTQYENGGGQAPRSWLPSSTRGVPKAFPERALDCATCDRPAFPASQSALLEVDA